MSLLFNTPSRFIIAFLPRSNHLLISWLQSPSAMILEPKKRKSVIAPTFSPICHEVIIIIISLQSLDIYSTPTIWKALRRILWKYKGVTKYNESGIFWNLLHSGPCARCWEYNDHKDIETPLNDIKVYLKRQIHKWNLPWSVEGKCCNL